MPSRAQPRRSAPTAPGGPAGRARRSARRAARSRGRCTSARAISSRRRMPPESLSTRVSRAVGQVGDLQRALDRGAALAARPTGTGARTRRGSARRSASTSRLSSCGTTPHCARACLDSPGSVVAEHLDSSPSSAIACAVSIRIVVDLPAPFGPSRPTHVPSGTSRSSPSTAVIGPKRLTTPRSRMAGESDMRPLQDDRISSAAVSRGPRRTRRRDPTRRGSRAAARTRPARTRREAAPDRPGR